MSHLAVEFAWRSVRAALPADWDVSEPEYDPDSDVWTQSVRRWDTKVVEWTAFGVSELDVLENMASDLSDFAWGKVPDAYE